MMTRHLVIIIKFRLVYDLILVVTAVCAEGNLRVYIHSFLTFKSFPRHFGVIFKIIAEPFKLIFDVG